MQNVLYVLKGNPLLQSSTNRTQIFNQQSPKFSQMQPWPHTETIATSDTPSVT